MKTRKLILYVLLFWITNSTAQEALKKIVINDRKNHLTEIFYVKRPDKIIKQGQYQLFGRKKKLFIEGNYNNNNHVGIWKFYSNSGELIRQFDFSKDSLIEYNWNKNDSNKLRVKTSGGWIKKEVSSPPFPLYGDLNFIINHNLKYPKEAIKTSEQGKVVISVLIDKTGAVHGYRVDTKLSVLLNEEALRVIKLIPAWYPAICDGEKIECEYLIPVEFQLK